MFMSNACASRATFLPMLPRPTMPSVLPWSSNTRESTWSPTTSSKPGGVSNFAMSRIASGCLGMKTILVAMSGSFCGLTRRLRQRNGRRHADLVAENARRVSLARRVLDESRVARAEHVLRAVAKADLELSGENDHELAARGRMPVEELAGGPLPKRDLTRGEPLQPVGLGLEVDRLDVRLLVRARVQPECPHCALHSQSRLGRRGPSPRVAQMSTLVVVAGTGGDASIEADP